jgi:hypothetical protein
MLILLLRQAKQALEGERAAQAKPVPRERSARLAECRHRLRQGWELERRVVAEHADWLAAGIASDGSRRMSGARHNIQPYPLPEQPAGKINVTDPDSRNFETMRGWAQGYNARSAPPAARSSSPRRSASSRWTRSTCRRWSTPPSASSPESASSTRRECWPTAATGRGTPIGVLARGDGMLGVADRRGAVPAGVVMG